MTSLAMTKPAPKGISAGSHDKCLRAHGMALERWFPVDPRIVPIARHMAYRTAKDLGASDDESADLDLAIGEALANAVRYGAPDGCAPRRHDYICLGLWKYDGVLIATVHNRGPGFDPPPPPYVMPTPEAESTHGRGLPLMQMLTDALLISRGDCTERGASVYLVKRIAKRDFASY